jgi:hypothetical protein
MANDEKGERKVRGERRWRIEEGREEEIKEGVRKRRYKSGKVGEESTKLGKMGLREGER